MELHEKLRNICEEHNVVIWTAQQPQRKFSSYTRLMQLTPNTGEDRYLGFPMDHVNLINGK
tara:strand:- start:545 stop:727 length:183 start_codon:yes stop_codon:yes gene_type:complete